MTDPQPPSPYGPPAQAGPPWQQSNPYAQSLPYGTAPLRPRTNPLAIVSICASGSIIVLFALMLLLPAVGLLPGLAGVVTGHIALSQIKRSGEQGRGLAITGLVVGYATVGLLLAGFVAALAFFAIVGVGGAFSY